MSDVRARIRQEPGTCVLGVVLHVADAVSPIGLSGCRRYVRVLRRSGVARPALGTAVASLPIGMLGLAVLLLVRQSGGGFAHAGAVVAALSGVRVSGSLCRVG